MSALSYLLTTHLGILSGLVALVALQRLLADRIAGVARFRGIQGRLQLPVHNHVGVTAVVAQYGSGGSKYKHRRKTSVLLFVSRRWLTKGRSHANKH